MNARRAVGARTGGLPPAARLRRRLRRRLSPRSLERKYSRYLLGFVRSFRVEVRRTLVPELKRLASEAPIAKLDSADIRLDANYAASVKTVMAKIARSVWAQFPNHRLSQDLHKLGREVDEYSTRELRAQFVDALGIDLYTTVAPEVVEGFVTVQMTLIKSVADRYLHDIEQEVTFGLERGVTVKELTKRIAERGDVSESRAKVIARDQIGKLNGSINMHRQRSAGVKKFIWRTMGDNRVRDSHDELDGREFTWAKGANGIFPGDEIQCRCYAEPVLEEFDDDDETPEEEDD